MVSIKQARAAQPSFSRSGLYCSPYTICPFLLQKNTGWMKIILTLSSPSKNCFIHVIIFTPRISQETVSRYRDKDGWGRNFPLLNIFQIHPQTPPPNLPQFSEPALERTSTCFRNLKHSWWCGALPQVTKPVPWHATQDPQHSLQQLFLVLLSLPIPRTRYIYFNSHLYLTEATI